MFYYKRSFVIYMYYFRVFDYTFYSQGKNVKYIKKQSIELITSKIIFGYDWTNLKGYMKLTIPLLV